MSTLIVGAGLCGLSLAQELKAKGATPTILDKSRGVGGRLATRRIEELGFDHGAPTLPNSDELAEMLTKANIKFKIKENKIHPQGGMSLFPKNLAKDLNLHKDKRAKKIEHSNGEWKVTTTTGEEFQAKNLIITAPLPQALELLEENHLLNDEFKFLKDITYTKAIILLGILDDRTLEKIQKSIPEGGYLMKDRGLHPSGVVFDAGPSWSDEHFEMTDDIILKLLQERFEELLGQTIAWKYCEVKKWRYARPLSHVSAPFIEVARGLYLAGDAFGQNDSASNALFSSRSLAQRLIPT